jgi:hypothetical protein
MDIVQDEVLRRRMFGARDRPYDALTVVSSLARIYG